RSCPRLDHYSTSCRSATRLGFESSSRFGLLIKRDLELNALVHHLSMQGEIEALALGILGDAQANEHLDHEEADQADHSVIYEHGGDTDALVDELGGIAFQETRGATELLHRKNPRQKRADDAAQRVHAKAIQCIVVVEDALQPGAAPVAGDTGGDADGKGSD